MKDVSVCTILSILIATVFVFSNCEASSLSEDHESLYGNVTEEDYLRGNFEPSLHPLFVNIANLGIPCNGAHWLRKEAAEALKKMYDAFKKDIPHAQFWIQSATRNFNDQKNIWERRWKEYAPSKKNATDIASTILRFLSMPGTSRHHWGTDFDINILNNSYYEHGNGALVYNWLKKNASAFGFCQPYTAGRKNGHYEEKWHWSYIPLAKIYHNRWNVLFGSSPHKIIKNMKFLGSKITISKAPQYVNAINEECVK